MHIISREALMEACKIVGSQCQLARLLGIKRSKVSHWMNRGDRVSHENVLAIERATNGKVTRYDLVPKWNYSSHDAKNVDPTEEVFFKILQKFLEQLTR